MKLRAKSLWRINMAPRNRCIASLAVWPSCGAQFLTFLGNNSLQWWWNWNETCLWLHISQPEGRTCTERKYILKLAEFMASLTASCCFIDFPCLDVLIFHLSFEIRERFSILSPLFHWNRFYFVAAAILFPAFQPGLKTWNFLRFFNPFARAENPIIPG